MEFGEVRRPPRDVSGADGRDEGGIESSGEEDAPRYVGHHAAYDGLFEGVAEYVGRVFLLGRGEAGEEFWRPGRLVPPDEFIGVGPFVGVDVPWREGLEFGAFSYDGLHLAGDVDRAVVSPADVERGDADVVAADEKEVLGFVV